MKKSKGRVTGLGGIFFKCQDPEALRDWYRDQLGLKTNPYGSLFETRNTDDPSQRNFMQWSTFSQSSTYMQPSAKGFMLNYRVDDLDALLHKLRAAGVEIVGEIEVFEYGKFAHIMDPEGNKIELWEPIDGPFAEEYGPEDTTH